MKKWMALALVLVTVLTLVACGETTWEAPFKSDWGTAEGYNGKILGVWYNIEENAGDETVYGFVAGGDLLFAKSVDEKEAYSVFYAVDEESKTVSCYNCDKADPSKKGELAATYQIVENGDVIYLIGENTKGEPIGMAREADLEAARAAYPEIAKPAK